MMRLPSWRANLGIECFKKVSTPATTVNTLLRGDLWEL